MQVLELINRKKEDYPSLNITVSFTELYPCNDKVIVLECNLRESPKFIQQKLESKWVLTEGPLKKIIGVGVFHAFCGPTVHTFYFNMLECDIEKNIDLIQVMLNDLAPLA
jgi:hypothetical protein